MFSLLSGLYDFQSKCENASREREELKKISEDMRQKTLDLLKNMNELKK